MRDAVCAEVASCGRSLQLMCPDIVIWLPNHMGIRAARVHSCAKYVGAVESIFSSRVRAISCPSVVAVR